MSEDTPAPSPPAILSRRDHYMLALLGGIMAHGTPYSTDEAIARAAKIADLAVKHMDEDGGAA